MKEKKFIFLFAIILAGALAGGAAFLAQVNMGTIFSFASSGQSPVPIIKDPLDSVRPISNQDYVRGGGQEPISIIVYTDFECPFCKQFHQMLSRLVAEYPNDLKIIYRHFPLDQLHPVKARTEAMALECAAEQKGNDGFWKYADRLFELSQSNNKTDLLILPKIAGEIGLDRKKFYSCLENSEYDAKIDADIRDAMETGGQGTPWSVMITKKGEKIPINGNQPYEVMRQVMDLVIEAEK